jgi:endonuclease YncB( thermonuclease family)
MGPIIDCPSAYVVDGDSLRCGAERLRLLGIDAPELHGCPRWRTCVSGNGDASKASLRQAVRQGAIRYRFVTRDRFGRAVVVAWAGAVNLSCWQLVQGQAVYKPHWDNGGLIVRACGK